MKSNEEYWNQSPEHQAKRIVSEGDYDYEHALRWVLGGVILYERTTTKPSTTRELAATALSYIRVGEGIGSDGDK